MSVAPSVAVDVKRTEPQKKRYEASERFRFVAQSFTLLYRLVTLGMPSDIFTGFKDLVPRRMQFCDTAECNSALRSLVDVAEVVAAMVLSKSEIRVPKS